MAAANKALKKRAKDFAETHGLSYLAALKAVDEPLHELRDLSRTQNEIQSHHFRLVGEQSIYSSAYDVPSESPLTEQPEYRSFVYLGDFSRYGSGTELVLDIARRIEALEAVGAKDIWEYRELQRSGIHGELTHFEPFFHHFGKAIENGYELIFDEGHRLGIFAVAIATYIEIEVNEELMPLTLKQFDALKGGSPAGVVEFPLTLPWSHELMVSDPAYCRSIDLNTHEKLTIRARSIFGYSRNYRDGSRIRPTLQLFFRSDSIKGAKDHIRELGMDPTHFKFDLLPVGEFWVQRRSNFIAISLEKYDPEYSGFGSTQSVVIV